MRKADQPIAVFCSDIHLSDKAPIARRREDWFSVQAKYLDQLAEIAGKAPIIIAGDLFDRWNSSAELINLALAHLPECYAIPGQHDLPYHRMELIHRSAYWTLVLAGKIHPIPEDGLHLPGVSVYGFGWGQLVTAPPPDEDCFAHAMPDNLKVAAVHAMVWSTADTAYPGVSEHSNVSAWEESLKGYDYAFFGDNHKGFQAGKIFNCGTFFRRKADEIDYIPRVGLLTRGGVNFVSLDVSDDLVDRKVEASGERTGGFDKFVKGLTGLQSEELDFHDLLNRRMRGCSEGVKRVLAEVVDDGSRKS